MMRLNDRSLTCRICGSAFVLTAAEQELLLLRGVGTVPAHCPICQRSRQWQVSYQPSAISAEALMADG
ncbi:MAG: zinc-ribbon domain containing protein [Chloroflexi bacterium]|nr:zinc-ribbon domain containing protein [Chloroflexota bacterium]